MNKEESFKEYCLFHFGHDGSHYPVADNVWDYLCEKYEKLLAEKDEQIEEAKSVISFYAKKFRWQSDNILDFSYTTIAECDQEKVETDKVRYYGGKCARQYLEQFKDGEL